MKRIKLELTEDQQKRVVEKIDWETWQLQSDVDRMQRAVVDPSILKGRHNQAGILRYYEKELPNKEKELAFNKRLLRALKAKSS